MLNTRIRGAQIVLTAEVLDVSADAIAFVDADGVLKQESVVDFMALVDGNGLLATTGVLAVQADGGTITVGASGIKVSDDSIDDGQLNAGAGTPGQVLTLGTGTTLEWSTPANDTDELVKATNDTGDTAGYLKDVVVNLNAGVVAVDEDSLVILDGTDSIAKLESIADIATGMAGSGLTATAGVLSVDAVTDNIVESDIVLENLSADIDATGYAGVHALANDPVVSSVQVFLNGLLQEEGSGKDYTLGGTGSKTVTFATAPISGDIVLAHYVKNN